MFHGLALNVRCDMMPLRRLIVPCGLASSSADGGVVSLREILGDAALPALPELAAALHEALEASLGRRLAVTFDGQRVLDRFPGAS